MNSETQFTYEYSAKGNEEFKEIRSRYLPKEETKLDELRRLDRAVRGAGTVSAVCLGIIGTLIFGTGMCLAMQVLATGALFMALGVIVGVIGAAVMLAAYPLYRKAFNKAKEKHAPRILELTSEISGENHKA